MKVVSVNVGLPRTITWKGRTVETGIFKALIELSHRDTHGVAVADVARLYRHESDDFSLLQRAV
jgi:hypothetical protein